LGWVPAAVATKLSEEPLDPRRPFAAGAVATLRQAVGAERTGRFGGAMGIVGRSALHALATSLFSPSLFFPPEASKKLDPEIEDRNDDLLFNEIIWKAVKGKDPVMPPPMRSAFVLPR
jgi:hypothetical protein